jgi:hypothetical protein
VAQFFQFASAAHPVWSPLANKIHKVVFDSVGIKQVREHVRRWATEFNQQQDRASQAHLQRAETASQVVESGHKRWAVAQKIAEHWSDSLGIGQAECFRMALDVIPPQLHAEVPPGIDGPELSLPLPHRKLTEPEQWAVLAAIHDFYSKHEKINPWPEPPDTSPPWTVPQDDDRYNEVKKAWEASATVVDEAWPFKKLLDRMLKLTDTDVPVFREWLTKLAQNKVSPAIGDPGDHAETPADGKGVAPRNDWFLAQYETKGTDTYHKPAKIHTKWAAMKATERAEICPDNPNKVTKDAVAKAINRALVKRNDLKSAKAGRKPKKKP